MRRLNSTAPRATAAFTSRSSKTSRGMQYAGSFGSATTSRPSGLRSRSRPTGVKPAAASGTPSVANSFKA